LRPRPLAPLRGTCLQYAAAGWHLRWDTSNSVAPSSPLQLQLRIGKVTNAAASKLARINEVRKNIARVLTVLNQKKMDEARAATQKLGLQRVPKRLRAKKTRALRRALTPHQVRYCCGTSRASLRRGIAAPATTCSPRPSPPLLQKSLKTERALKKEQNFPLRKFALKA